MPDALKTELLHYAEYLITKSDQTEEDKQAAKESVTVKRTLAGSMKGTRFCLFRCEIVLKIPIMFL